MPDHTLAILSSDRLPKFLGDSHPNEESLFAEDLELIARLGDLGIEAHRVPWRDQDVAWGRFDAVVIRSTWDYIDDISHYLNVLVQIDASGANDQPKTNDRMEL